VQDIPEMPERRMTDKIGEVKNITTLFFLQDFFTIFLFSYDIY